MVAATFLNPSFEIGEGTSGTVTSNGFEPFSLSDPSSLILKIDQGLEDVFVFESGSRSTILSANTETFTLADGQTLDVSVDGAIAQTITFNTADFVDITNATAVEVVAVILDTLIGGFAAVDTGAVRLTSLTKGVSSLINVTGGTAAAAFAFPAGVNGVDYFADINNATALEVVARINAQTSELVAVDSGGRIELTSSSSGNQSCLQIIGGSANLTFLFPLTEFCGLSQDGLALGWTPSSLSTHVLFAQFNVGFNFPGAFETFSLGFSGNENDVTSLKPQTIGLFGGGQLAEFYDWFGDKTDLPGQVSATFNTTPPLIAGNVEDYSQGWPGIPGDENDGTELPLQDPALFNSGVDPEEDYNTGWRDNQNDGTVLPPQTPVVFGQGGAFETYAPTTTVYFEATVITVVAAHVYSIVVDGVNFFYQAQGGDSPNDVAVQLEAAVNNGILPISASVIGNSVLVSHDTPGTPMVFSVGGTNPIEISLTNTNVDPTTTWTGSSLNPAV